MSYRLYISPHWCNVVNIMTNNEITPRSETNAVRASISFPAEHYAELERLAHARKVSLAWVVRDAVEKYLAEQWPLFEKQTLR